MRIPIGKEGVSGRVREREEREGELEGSKEGQREMEGGRGISREIFLGRERYKEGQREREGGGRER